MVVSSPRSGLLQGAEQYLRGAAARKNVHPEIAAMLRAVLDEWDDAQCGSTAVSQATAG
ncbi:hypothetical protein [Streptomyces sp. Agncl-13]|uniref:hypothetical protein n=1 Tax=Streptomyces sp. Agncl-13 TaxID=3400628 RepID=UPI003A8B7FCD